MPPRLFLCDCLEQDYLIRVSYILLRICESVMYIWLFKSVQI